MADHGHQRHAEALRGLTDGEARDDHERRYAERARRPVLVETRGAAADARELRTSREAVLSYAPGVAREWDRLDLVHGMVHMDRERTGNPRPVPIDADIVRALERWRKLTPMPAATKPVFVDMTGRPIRPDEAKDRLHQALRTAKVERAELYAKSPKREPLRWHDLRASW